MISKYVIIIFYIFLIIFPHDILKSEVQIVVDASKNIGSFNHFYNGVAMGSFKDGFLLPYNRKYFELLANTNQRKRLFFYVSGKGMFMDKPSKRGRDDGAHIYQRDELGNVSYNWNILDTVLDKILGNGLKPIISLTFMPQDLASNVKRRNPWNKGIVSPPKDYNAWRELIYQTVKHLRERHGSSEIRTWYFEVWNEPDLFKFFWIPHPDQKKYSKRSHFEEYFKLYDYTVDGALAADPSIKIGGPGLAGDKLFFKKFLKHCLYGRNYSTGDNGTRLDFISRHHYGNIEKRILPHFKTFVDIAKEIGGEFFKKFEILVTETGPSTTPKPWLNTRYVAAWIVKEVAGFLDLEDKYGRDYVPDAMFFWTKPVPKNFQKHFGLVSVLGKKWSSKPDALVKRPAFNGYETLSYLENERIGLTGANFGDDIHGIATKESDTSITILLYHLNENDKYNSDSTMHRVNLKIQNLPFSRYYLYQYKIDDNHSNGYAEWKSFGSPSKANDKEVTLLQTKDDLELCEPVSLKNTSNGVIDINLKMQSNSVSLIILSQERGL